MRRGGDEERKRAGEVKKSRGVERREGEEERKRGGEEESIQGG